MKLSKILLSLFSFFSLLSVLGVFIHNDYIFLVSKTCVFPCILFYYFDKMQKLNYLFIVVLLIFYIVDILLILDIKNLIFYLALLLNINHVIILGYSIKNIEKKKIDSNLFTFTLFMFLLGGFIQYLIFDLIKTQNIVIAYSIFISGIIVAFFNSISLYNYLNRNSYVHFYFGFGCLSIALMYACYDIYRYVYYLDVLKILSLIFKVASYYLFIKFMLANEKLEIKRTSTQ